MAAGVVAMCARSSTSVWEDAARTAEKADAVRARVAPLGQADAQAYEEYLSARRLTEDLEPEVREIALEISLSRAAALPLLIAEAGAQVAELAAETAANGARDTRPDAAAAAVLAHAGARAAAHLVAVNADAADTDERAVRARELADEAGRAAERALAE